MITLTKPELRSVAANVRAQLAGFTKTGGSIPLSQFAGLLGELPETVQGPLAKYSPIAFNADGTFAASGPQIKFNTGNEEVIVPAALKGDWSITAEKAILTFDKGAEVEVGVKFIFFIGEHITGIEIDDDGITISSDKSAGSVQIGFGAPPLPAPADLAAAPGKTYVNIAWQSVAGATGYDVEADGEPAATNISETSWTHAGLTPGTEHSYRVAAVNPDQQGPFCPPVTATTHESTAQAVVEDIVTGGEPNEDA